jgi:hypothetical protein
MKSATVRPSAAVPYPGRRTGWRGKQCDCNSATDISGKLAHARDLRLEEIAV